MKHRREKEPSKSAFFRAKQPFDRCGQAIPDAPARQSTRLADTKRATDTFLSSTSSRDRSITLQIFTDILSNRYTRPKDFAIHLSCTWHDRIGRDMNSSTSTTTFLWWNLDSGNPAYFILTTPHRPLAMRWRKSCSSRLRWTNWQTIMNKPTSPSNLSSNNVSASSWEC